MNRRPIKQIEANGTVIWTLNGDYHREDGAAVEFANGAKFWYLNGLRHRKNGPAIEYANGYRAWFLHGTFIRCVRDVN